MKIEDMMQFEIKANAENSPVLFAYVGDAWYTLFCRAYLIERYVSKGKKINDIHNMAKKIVSAVVQAESLQAINDELTEDELAVVRRGRNTKMSVPKSATVAQYRLSTGFEALFGYLLYQGRKERMAFLAGLAVDSIISDGGAMS